MIKERIDPTIFRMHAEICKTLSNPTRLMILAALQDGERTVNELVELIGVSQSNASQHLSVLRQRQIVTARKQGANTYYSVSNPKINKACAMLREVLMEQLQKNNEIIRGKTVTAKPI
ncbi:MAG: metalloregulator ArsR/SmtB family transcription factor [Candidatus Bathyarchaeota archaeon]